MFLRSHSGLLRLLGDEAQTHQSIHRRGPIHIPSTLAVGRMLVFLLDNVVQGCSLITSVYAEILIDPAQRAPGNDA